MDGRTAGRFAGRGEGPAAAGRRARTPDAALVFLGAAFLLGGAGVNYPLVQLAIVGAALVAWVRGPGFGAVWRPSALARAGLGLFAAWAAVMAAQMLPLPPGVWRALPGRETAAAVWDAAGLHGWHPLSLTPDVTLAGLLALIAPVVAFGAVAGMTRRGRRRVLRLLIAVAGVGTVFGVLQIATGIEAPLYVFETFNRGVGTGLFVDRNHQAAFLLVALIVAQVPGVVDAWLDERGAARGHGRILALMVSALLAIGVAATLSRTGLVLLPAALLAGGAAAAVGRGPAGRGVALGGVIALAALGVAVFLSPVGQDAVTRFAGVGDDNRPLYWANTVYALRRSLPFGTGFGSFVPVYMGIEPLGQVVRQYVNHAHSDMLEIVLEGGIAAAAIALAAVAAAGAGVALAWRRGERALAIAVAAGLACLAGFSAVEYPLRMTALAVVAAVLAGLLVPAPEESAAPGRRPRALLAAGLLALIVGANQIGLACALAGWPGAATRVAPWLAVGWRNRADAALAAGDIGGAFARAGTALAIAPLDATAARVRALAMLARGDAAGGAALMGATAQLGWRDVPTQAWLAQAAMLAGREDIAVPHLDALLREEVAGGAMTGQLRAQLRRPGGEAALIAAMALHPGWRQALLNALADEAVVAPDAVIGFMADLARAGVPVRPGEAALIRWRLADHAMWPHVAQAWRAGGGHGLIGDGDFAGLSGPVAAYGPPYAWRAPPLPGVSVTAGTGEGRNGVRIVSDGMAEGVAFAQTVVLAPGAYRLAVAYGPGGDGAPGWVWRCLGGGPAGGQPVAGGGFVVPAGCPAVELGATLATDPARAPTFTVLHVAVSPAAVP